MKYSLVLAALLGALSLSAAPQPMLYASAEPTVSDNTSEANAEITMNQMPEPIVEEEIVTAPPAPAAVTATTPHNEPVLKQNQTMLISVVGQGVAPVNTASPAQAYALAKRAAVADAYRLIAEKVKGVRIDGQDLIKNMMVKRSTVRTSVSAMVRNANVVETTFKEGLCEVEMEIRISHAQFK